MIKEIFAIDNIEYIIAVITIMTVITGIMTYFHKQQIARLRDMNALAYKKLDPKSQKEVDQKAVVQEEKIVYVKYLYIRKKSDPPVYKKFLRRTGKYIDVNSEYHYYRFNKFNTKNNGITIRDATSGAVALNVIYPWRDLVFTDSKRKTKLDIVEQDLNHSDSYFTVSTYFNGFNEGEEGEEEGNEDIAMKMEMDTVNARLIADFSSIVGFDKLFIKAPDVYHKKTDGTEVKILGLEEINEGVYHISKRNLKKGEVIFLDFHVDWDFLKK